MTRPLCSPATPIILGGRLGEASVDQPKSGFSKPWPFGQVLPFGAPPISHLTPRDSLLTHPSPLSPQNHICMGHLSPRPLLGYLIHAASSQMSLPDTSGESGSCLPVLHSYSLSQRLLGLSGCFSVSQLPPCQMQAPCWQGLLVLLTAMSPAHCKLQSGLFLLSSQSQLLSLSLCLVSQLRPGSSEPSGQPACPLNRCFSPCVPK